LTEDVLEEEMEKEENVSDEKSMVNPNSSKEATCDSMQSRPDEKAPETYESEFEYVRLWGQLAIKVLQDFIIVQPS
jgi:hypothetical protein